MGMAEKFLLTLAEMSVLWLLAFGVFLCFAAILLLLTRLEDKKKSRKNDIEFGPD